MPLLATPVGLPASLVIGAAAFGASELVLGGKKKEEILVGNRNIKEVLETAKKNNSMIKDMINKIEDMELRSYIASISTTSERIINTIQANPKKFKRAETFFDYYLPMTLKFITNYDEIENQRLTSKDSTKFMTDAKEKIKMLNQAFEKQLSSLYQTDIVDMDAEMKVLDMMLKSEGLSGNELNSDK